MQSGMVYFLMLQFNTLKGLTPNIVLYCYVLEKIKILGSLARFNFNQCGCPTLISKLLWERHGPTQQLSILPFRILQIKLRFETRISLGTFFTKRRKCLLDYEEFKQYCPLILMTSWWILRKICKQSFMKSPSLRRSFGPWNLESPGWWKGIGIQGSIILRPWSVEGETESLVWKIKQVIGLRGKER